MTLRKFYSHCPEAVSAHYTIYDTTPTTFIVQSSLNDPEYTALVQKFNEISAKNFSKEKVPPKHCSENVWLIKPCAQNQGKGIEFFRNNLMDMKKYLQSKPPFSHWVVQKYIERPLLYHGRKFDIRVWALITHKKILYFYKYGYIRTSAEYYTLDSNKNYVHLTNNCLQKYGDKYGSFEEGNTLGFDVFSKYLTEMFPGKNIDFDKMFVSRMKDIIIDVYRASQKDLNQVNRKNCFELLGFDFLMDEDLRLWLLEVNINPYLGVPNKYIEGLLPKMLDDLYQIVLDPYVTPANPAPPHDLENNFELLYCESMKINKRRPYNTPVYPLGIPADFNGKPTVKTEEEKSATEGSNAKKTEENKKISFSQLAKDISTEPSTETFTTFSDKFNTILKNGKSMSQYEIKDASKSIKLIAEGLKKDTFFECELFISLIKATFDLSSDLADPIKTSVVLFVYFRNL